MMAPSGLSGAVRAGVAPILCATLVTCSAGTVHKPAGHGPTVTLPSFSIAVKLSLAAANRLHDIGETVQVIAYFDGDALPGQGKYNPPMRPVYLGMAERLVDGNGVAQFEGVMVPQEDWNRLSDRDFFVTINTVSARRVAEDNLLDCADPISVKISSMQRKATEVPCSLIGER